MITKIFLHKVVVLVDCKLLNCRLHFIFHLMLMWSSSHFFQGLIAHKIGSLFWFCILQKKTHFIMKTAKSVNPLKYFFLWKLVITLMNMWNNCNSKPNFKSWEILWCMCRVNINIVINFETSQYHIHVSSL